MHLRECDGHKTSERADIAAARLNLAQRATLRSLCNIRSLRTLGALGDLEFNLITFLQALVSFRRNRAVVHKDVSSIFAADKPVPLGIVEPLHRTFQAFHVRPLRARTLPVASRASRFSAIFRLLEEAVKRYKSPKRIRRRGYRRRFRAPHFWLS